MSDSSEHAQLNISINATGQVVIGRARFSLLDQGLVRMEDEVNGQFEDRPSIRALTRGTPQPFAAVNEGDDGWVSLSTPAFSLRYRPDGQRFHAGNLRVHWADGRELWTPGQIDDINLGAAHVSMDVVSSRTLAQGVHPAGDHRPSNDNRWNLWAVKWRPNEENDTEGRYRGLSPYEALALRGIDDYSAEDQAIIRERARFPDGLLSRKGYWLYNDSGQSVLDPGSNWVGLRNQADDAIDWYLFAYGDDINQAFKSFTGLCGHSPMIPRYSLGLWYSRYPTFNEAGLRELVDTFATHHLPLDMLVLDLEWHQRGWYGFDWDTEHIPNPQGLLDDLASQQIHTTFNVHPDAVPVDDSRFDEFCCQAGIDPTTIEAIDWSHGKNIYNGYRVNNQRHVEALLDVLHLPIQQQGMDFWWMDGYIHGDSKGQVDVQLWTNEAYQRHIFKHFPDRRPMVFTRTPGVGAHRYPFHFTGDTVSEFPVLAHQVEFTLRAGHLAQSYMTHDIGGHMTNVAEAIDPELYMRWVQFGALSPVFRLHSGGGNERRPWEYPAKCLKSFKAAVKTRMELLPYLYTVVRESADTGLPMCRSHAIALPEWEAGYDIWTQYFLGDRLYCTPMVDRGTVQDLMLPPGEWYDLVSGERESSDGSSTIRRIRPYADMPPHYCRAGVLLIRQAYALRAGGIPETLYLDYYAASGDSEDHFSLYEDDGESIAHRDGAYDRTDFHCRQVGSKLTICVSFGDGDFVGRLDCRRFVVRIHGAVAQPLDDLWQSITQDGPSTWECQGIATHGSYQWEFQFTRG